MKMNLSEVLSTKNKSQIYLLHGLAECYPYIAFALNKIQQDIPQVIRHQFQVDRYFKFEEIYAILDNVSLFSEQNLIELNFKTKPLAAQEEDLVKLINKIDSNSFLFITTEKLTGTTSNWLKAIHEKGTVILVTEADTITIINHMCSLAKLKINKTALDLLIELNSGNIPELMQEITRLTILYPENHEISLSDIQSANNAQYNIYQLSNAYLKSDLATSQKILANLYHESADAILITWIINEDVKKLIKIKAQQKSQANIDKVLSELRIWGEALTNFKNAVNRISYNNLLKILDQLANLDVATKGISRENPYILLQQIIQSLCC